MKGMCLRMIHLAVEKYLLHFMMTRTIRGYSMIVVNAIQLTGCHYRSLLMSEYVVVVKSIFRGIDTVKGTFPTRAAAQHYIDRTKRRFQARAVIARLEKVV